MSRKRSEWLVLAAVVPLVVLGACSGSGATTPAARGRQVYETSGCISCHGVDGQGSVGPPLRGLFGTRVALADGRVVTADAAYLERAIRDPRAEVPKGVTLVMPRDELTARQVDDLVAYLRAIGPSGD